MKVSLNWLEDYVRISVPPKRLAEMLTVSGTKVEAIHRPAEGIEGIVVAEVLGIEAHPNADNLSMVEVTTGTEQQRVVCGAANFAVGDKVPYAAVGARLPELTISERKIRGEISRGMLCSPAELGISKDHAGLLVLPADAPVGNDIVSVLGLDDTILELEITPNRPDCMGMIGVAREVAALLDTDLKVPALSDAATGEGPRVAVKLEDAAGCPRYVAHLLDDVKVGPSLGWVAARLLAAGIRPISNVVDATNYVLMETGQPLHAFDAAKVDDLTIVVRRARRGERLTTLDGAERPLDPADLVVADPRKALALAGVMGGEDSEVGAETTTALVESAHFDPPSIARTARRHGLRTEASARFERGSDPDICGFAAARCSQFIGLTADAGPAVTAVDEYPVPRPRPIVTLRPRRTEALLGIRVTAQAQAQRLHSIQLPVVERDDVLDVEVPGFRPDIAREVDLIEEVARLGGFEELPETLPAGGSGGLTEAQRRDRTMRRQLAGFGLTETWSSSLASAADLDALGLDHDHPARRSVVIENPMIEQENRMRTTLLPSLLRSAARNVAHRQIDLALFELARVYEPADGPLPSEPMRLAAFFSGLRVRPGWDHAKAPWDFFAAKGVLHAAAHALASDRDIVVEAADGMPFHPSRAATVRAGADVIGVLGELHPEVCERFSVPEASVAFEVDVAGLLGAPDGRMKIGDLPRFPSIAIDIAVVVDEAITAGDVHRVIAEAGVPELVHVALFDLYRGDQIPDGKKSLAYALELRVADRTLTDDDAVAVRDRIVAALADSFRAVLRS